MSEINKKDSINRPAINSAFELGFKGAEKANCGAENVYEKNITDLGNNPHDYLGRSQVKKINIDGVSFSAEITQNLEKDIETFLNNPKLVQKSDVMFEKTLKTSKENDAYSKAVMLQSEFVNELK